MLNAYNHDEQTSSDLAVSPFSDNLSALAKATASSARKLEEIRMQTVKEKQCELF